ncbi:MAG TPA: right-handed parallel beta-helix repeat-containing protein [Gemmataceae bacterium]|nr:right-handed parallel beta-helix repeat-containing protein [Gemmataceae bacterium]
MLSATVYTVNSLLDTNTGSGDAGTLRYVINQANANNTGVAGTPDIIQFATGGGTIAVDSADGGALPALTDVAVIDATTEIGYSGIPLVTLDGTSAGVGANGLTISGGSSTVKGLAIVNFAGNGIQLDTNGNDQVFSCYIGLNTIGSSAGNTLNGIFIDNTSGNIIGGSTSGAGNIISANRSDGILIDGANALSNQVVGNFIGTDASGTGAHGNAGNGIHILGASNNTIGGASAGAGNVISANSCDGILMEGINSTNNVVAANFIGTTVAGTAPLGNGCEGIDILDASNNTIGGAATGAGNVISTNGSDGILIDGVHATDNLVVANFIGTDVTGNLAFGNVGNGIQITNGARLNTIGGNTPTATAFTGKPVDGNVISANHANGVFLSNGAEFNTLSGNFIGTNLAGTSPLGNALDGVAIVDANNNSLIGTTFPQQPFVYLNLICANGGNGLRITDSNNTTVQANSFGLGDDNATALGNALDGVLIGGTSTNTQFGGVIPLGNISAANGGNGVEIADTASGTVVFNTFCGLPAFVDTAVGNHLDGILVSSTGGNNLLRTNVISGNLGNGVHITGNATGVQVSEDIIGMDTNGALPLGNGGDGVLIDANAHDNLIGGNQVSVILQNTISSNGGSGIAIRDNASNNQVFHSFIGTDILGINAYGNAGAGIIMSGNPQNNTIGGTGAFAQNLISANLSGGILLLGGASQGTQVINNLIGTDRTGLNALGNQGNGITITSSNNLIGGTSIGMGNVIAFNTQNGVAVDTGTSNAILGDSIFSNAALGILLANGGNDNQSAPVLTGAVQLTSTTVQITGTLTGAANTTYTLEIFASSSSTPPGQGKTLLDSRGVTTNASGVASFALSYPLPTTGTSFTATATDPANNTSSFSNVVFASTPSPSPSPSPAPSPTPTPTPVGRLTPFGLGFGPGFQLEIFDVDSQGQVFVQTLATLFRGNPTFVNTDLVFSNLHLLDGAVVGFLQAQDHSQDIMEVLNIANPFVFNAILAAIMKTV